MAFSNNNNSDMLGDINVTPLVDVMLVLLIIFMVAAPMIQQQVDVDLPQTQSEKSVSVKESDVVLTLTKNREIRIQNQTIPIQELQQKLTAIYKNKKTKEIFLQADQSIPYGFVVKVMALTKNAGISKMGMITDGEETTP